MRPEVLPIRTEAFFEFADPPEAVWPVFSKTDWLNHAAGLPPIQYDVAPRPEGGTRVYARARFYGITLRWEEQPFEWREPEYYRVERSFATGPIRQIIGGMEFARSGSGTRLRTFSEIYPANSFGKILAQLILAPQATSGMGKIAGHAREYLRGREQNQFPNLKHSAANEEAITAALTRLIRSLEADRAKRLVERLERLIRESADVELGRIRPFEVARKWNEDRWEVLHLFLQATRAGVLDLSWEVLCPNCRSTRAPVASELSMLKDSAHCEVCQIKFDAEFDKSVELKFTINPLVKTCEVSTFCLAGPSSKPHVLEQRTIAPGASLALQLPAERSSLRLRSPHAAEVVQGAGLIGRLTCRAGRFEGEALGEPIANEVQLHNGNDFPIVIQLERTGWSEDILTAASVTTLQEFRDLFTNQVVSPTEQIIVGQQIILFTDLRGSTAMYCGIGDAPAYALVRDHFEILRSVIRENRGGIVKTIGDAVMAAFADPSDALRAVRVMHQRVQDIFDRAERPVMLKSSLHLGPCLAVNANERLDYFGTTVNLAARLVDCCVGGDLALSDAFYQRSETQRFLREHSLSAEPAEMQFRGFATASRLWRVALTS